MGGVRWSFSGPLRVKYPFFHVHFHPRHFPFRYGFDADGTLAYCFYCDEPVASSRIRGCSLVIDETEKPYLAE
jgi:hypothetical protein